MIKYFTKESFSFSSECCFLVGKFDTDKTFHDEGTDYLADVIVIQTDKYFTSIRHDKDILDKDELSELKYITEEQYLQFEKLDTEFAHRCSLMYCQLRGGAKTEEAIGRNH